PADGGPQRSSYGSKNISPPSILALNAGASSLKFALFDHAEDGEPLARGCVERIGIEGGRLWMRTLGGRLGLDRSRSLADHRAAVEAVFSAIDEAKLPPPEAVGHRMAHGGARHFSPQRVDAALLESLRELIPLAPLSLPDEIACADAVWSR